MTMRNKILVRGLVQGVGFRPFVYSLAKRRELRGRVANTANGVEIDVEGESIEIDGFVAELETKPPPLSRVESVTREIATNVISFPDFQILPSESTGSRRIPISADIATCGECLAELFDPANRRFLYPFINCTNCGPRFTIVEDVPYDRERTTMREFEMCADCRAEYEDPGKRRFHAEATCCPECGPSLELFDAASSKDGNMAGRERGGYVLERARHLLDLGNILAIKGLGGYHLACDATDAGAVTKLRQRKYREDKPFAMMADSVDVIRRYCKVSAEEETLLNSRERPIVLLAKRSGNKIPDTVAPGVGTFGFMLPYTPLHHLLLNALDRLLVMTSGNVSDEPICYTDRDATNRLDRIADHYLTNDRRIHMRMDDSLIRIVDKGAKKTPYTIRRSRGYAPAPLKTSYRFEQPILACGAELKNTFCLASGDHAYISHHIGDLENLETLRSFTEGIEHYKRLFDIDPKVIAYDLHPEYLSTKYAHACEGVETKVGVQHHHAHIASCLADNSVEGDVIGVAMDGLGFGTDGKMWGGEFFVADLKDAVRIYHLDYLPLPGGTRAIREPWRMAAVYLQKTFADEFLIHDIDFNRTLDRSDWKTVRSMIAAGVNCPETSSMGRLFDAVSALLCLRSTVNYEGQAAIALENIAEKSVTDAYRFDVDGDGTIKAESVIRNLVSDLLIGERAAEVSARFHRAVADLIVAIAVDTRGKRHLNRVALSGGVFQNVFLLEAATSKLAEFGFEVFTHSRVPTNDGGISLGQAAVANAQIQSGRI